MRQVNIHRDLGWRANVAHGAARFSPEERVSLRELYARLPWRSIMAILIEKYFTIVVHNLIQIGSTQDDSEDAQQRTVAGVEWGRCRDFGNSAPSVEIRSPSMRVFPNRASQAVLGFSVVLPAILRKGCRCSEARKASSATFRSVMSTAIPDIRSGVPSAAY